MNSATKVAIFGRTTIVRESLEGVLSRSGFAVALSAAAIDAAQADPDVRIVLIVADDWDAGQLEQARALFSNAAILILGSTFDLEKLQLAFRLGASGYLLSQVTTERLVGCLRLVMLGEKVFPSELADELADGAARGGPQPHLPTLPCANLSRREREVVDCLMRGLSNKMISRRLAISEATVKVHVKGVLRKLNVDNRTQAAIWGTNAGLAGDQGERGSRH